MHSNYGAAQERTPFSLQVWTLTLTTSIAVCPWDTWMLMLALAGALFEEAGCNRCIPWEKCGKGKPI